MRQIIDNFLDPYELEVIQRTMGIDGKFPWFTSYIVPPEDQIECNPLDNWQLGHTFFEVHAGARKPLDLIDPIIRRLTPNILIRIKANLNPRTENIVLHSYHIDPPNDHVLPLVKTAVFYVNTNNGYTIFENDGQKVESVANRIVIFPASESHSGTSCTDQPYRCVINFNWI
jgi:hypothetical protein